MKQAERRKYHYIYKITRNDGSGKYYIGMHSTDDLEDGYFGSGTLLAASIRKHGKEVHSREILEFLPSRKDLKIRERQLVNEEIVNDPLCMNLCLGGEGGFSGHIQKELSKRGNLAISQKWKNDSIWADAVRLKISKSMCESSSTRFTGKTHTKTTKSKIAEKLSLKQQGEKNSQFGTCWVTNGIKPVKIKKEHLDEYLANGYRQGRK